MDCSNVFNFVAEFKRLCVAFNDDDKCGKECPMYDETIDDCVCFLTITNEHIYKLQKWSDEHSAKTYAMDFFEKFPSAKINRDGVSPICRDLLYGSSGRPCSKQIKCSECWNEEMPE